MEMDIEQVLTNMANYEQQVVMSEGSDSEGLTLSMVQTLITLYQKAIEYYSADDDAQYMELTNRM